MREIFNFLNFGRKKNIEVSKNFNFGNLKKHKKRIFQDFLLRATMTRYYSHGVKITHIWKQNDVSSFYYWNQFNHFARDFLANYFALFFTNEERVRNFIKVWNVTKIFVQNIACIENFQCKNIFLRNLAIFASSQVEKFRTWEIRKVLKCSKVGLGLWELLAFAHIVMNDPLPD